MRLSNIIIILSSFTILLNCSHTNTNGDNHSDSGISESAVTDKDTLIHSIPVNYMKSLDTLSGSQMHQTSSYKDILDLFEKYDYTPEAWEAGIRKVPRIFLTMIGDRWGTTTAQEITVLLKKQLFFRGLAPLILRANELITKDRDRLGRIRSAFKENQSVGDLDQKWIMKLANLYKVDFGAEGMTSSILDELWKRVDIVPPSLALGQGAEESGWGTSRFAASGNAIYGQWTWGNNAMIPEQQRKELGNYGIAAFGSLQESVSAYMLNLNTHNAYASLRDTRAALRKKGEKITGMVLSETLTKYSERGEEYVKTLKSLMEYNRLEPTDDAYLSNDPPVYLVPVEQ